MSASGGNKDSTVIDLPPTVCRVCLCNIIFGSSSMAGLRMDDGSGGNGGSNGSDHSRQNFQNLIKTTGSGDNGLRAGGNSYMAKMPSADNDDTAAEEEGDPEMWRSFNKNFRQVQSVLDRNRVLINQVNENQQSRIPGNMVKNVSLIQELNGNMSKVVSLYSDLSSNFTTTCHQRNRDINSKDGEKMVE